MLTLTFKVIGCQKPSIVISPDAVAWGKGDAFNRGTARVFKDEIRDPIQDRQVELLHHLDQATMANLVTGGQRIDVADQLIRFAHIAANDADQGLIHFAACQRTS